MTINQRVKSVRIALNLTQKEFGKKITLAQTYLSQIEKGDRDVTEKILKIICAEYNVNEEWLRTGKGEMFKQITREDAIADFVYQTLSAEDDTFQKRFILMLSNLNEKQWEVLQEMALLLANQAQPALQKQSDFDIEAELSSYRRELELEQTAKERSEASPDSKEA